MLLDRCLVLMLLCCAITFPASAARADLFKYRDRSGEEVSVSARFVRTARGSHILALPDGEFRLIPEAALISREAQDDPGPLTPDEAAKFLEDRFGAARFRSYVADPFVVGLVLSSDLPKASEVRAKNFLRKVAGFMDKVSRSFKRYIQELRIPAKEPEYPLVVLIFESDDDFDKYMTEGTNTNAATAKNVAGFYSGLSNYLAIRLHTCSTFEVPLHEAIHQQVYNRNFFQRLAPIPNWFDEGIATGFEANKGRINIGPTKISRRYARQALAGGKLSWEEMLDSDEVFHGNVLTGEAYGHAWSLHWLLITKYKVEYLNYIKLLAQKLPLEEEPEGKRGEDIREVFGKDIATLQTDFPKILNAGVKKQRVNLGDTRVAGKSLTSEGMGEVKLTAVRRVDEGGQLEVAGVLTNQSPYRNMSFLVTVETDTGMYTQWHIPELAMFKQAKLEKKYVTKVMKGGVMAYSQGYHVRIRSVPSDSSDAEKWNAGQTPVPVFGQR